MSTDALDRAVLARQVAIAQYELSNYDDAAHTLSAALREAPENLDADVRDTLRVGLLTVALLVSGLDREQLLADLSRGAAPAQASVGVALRVAALGAELADAPAVPDAAAEIEALLAANPPMPDGFDAHTTLWFALCMCERFDGLRAQLDAVERAPDDGWTRRQFAINLARSRLEQRLGQLDAATATHEANLEFGMDNATGRLLTLSGLASVCVDRGDIDRAVALVASMAVPPGRSYTSRRCTGRWVELRPRLATIKPRCGHLTPAARSRAPSRVKPTSSGRRAAQSASPATCASVATTRPTPISRERSRLPDKPSSPGWKASRCAYTA